MRKMYDDSKDITIEKLKSMGVSDADIPKLLEIGICHEVPLSKPKGEKSNHLIFNGGDRLEQAIKDTVEIYEKRMLTAKLKGKARRNGKDKETRGAWIKRLKAELRKELERFGCASIYIKRKIEDVDENIRRNIDLMLDTGSIQIKDNGDIETYYDDEHKEKVRELNYLKRKRKGKL